MKAETRIRKYGLAAYIRSCLHKEPTEELIQKYKVKYGEDIPIGQRYIYRTYDCWFEDEKTGEIEEVRNLNTRLHIKPTKQSDLDELEHDGRVKLGGSNWNLVGAELKEENYVFTKKIPPITKKPTTQQELPKELPKAQPIVKETLQEKRDSLAKAMRAAGATWTEIAEALNEVKITI